jgi:hypothetical protein
MLLGSAITFISTFSVQEDGKEGEKEEERILEDNEMEE